MKTKVSILSLALLSTSVAFAFTPNTPPKKMDFAVLFYDAATRHQGLPQQACVQMQKPFSFRTIGTKMDFNPKANPTYTDHKAIAYYPISTTEALQVDSVVTLFTYHGKRYKIPSLISCYMNKAPFSGRCIFSNKYCVSDYVLVYNEPSELRSPPLIKKN